MNASIVKRKPTGSSAAAAAIKAMSTLPACNAAAGVGRIWTVASTGMRPRAISTSMAMVNAAPITLSQNGKKPGPGPKASDSE